jgi:hypothetical protein
MKKTIVLSLSLIIGLAFLLGTSSCKKDRTCKASIFVIDTGGAPLAGVSLKIYSDKVSAETGVVSKILIEKTTTKSGRIDLEQSLPNILFMVVTKSGYTPVKPGIVSVKFQESITYFNTVEMRPM